MNTKDLITTIRGQQSLSAEEAELLFDATVKAIKKQLLDGNVVAVQGFGQFENFSCF